MSSKTKKTLKEDDIATPDEIEEIAEAGVETAELMADELTPEILEPDPVLTWQDVVGSVEQQTVTADDPIVQLVNEYKEAIKARDVAEDRYLRAAAEFANARRRAEMRADSEVRSSRERLLSNVLPVVDDFDRAFQSVPDTARESTWVEGFALIQRKLQNTLQREGVTPIEAKGQPFDATPHQAVMGEMADDVPSGTVLEVLQQGYMLDDRVLRPAMVKVAQ